ncbi:protein crumbs-like [Argonauta hians]
MSTSLSDRAYFNESGFLNIPHIWQLKSNSGLSFQTCSNGNGKLLHQVGATGNSLTLALNNGILNFQWQIDNSLSDVTVGEKLNDNSWYFVMFDYRLGNLRVKVQKGSDTLFSKLIANNTHNENIWKIKLENGSSLQLGLHFTGCLMSGPNVDLKLSNSTGTVYNGCFNEELKCNNSKIDFNDCYTYPCKNGGKCKDLIQNYTCICLPGFAGRNCELNVENQKCALNPCRNGNCTNTSTSFVCNCFPGFTGTYCDLNIDECETKPCAHGTCIDGINSYNCDCSGTGFKGSTCSENVNECAEAVNPCGTNKCVDIHGSYTCECPAGSAGKNCTDIDECLSLPCLNGATCKNLVNKYECVCIKGFQGEQCKTNIDDCTKTSCPWNNTICVDKINNFTCECKAGFNGPIENCQDIDECQNNPCKNNATCTNLENDFKCNCIPGFNGSLCDNDIDDCASTPCHNNATCNDGINNYTCNCVDGFTDFNCNTNIDDCVDTPCKNGATCYDQVQSYKCECTAGWTGQNCTEDFDECLSQPCQNAAQCINLLNDYNCSCLPGYKGKNCSIDIDECSGNPCQKGGSCKDLVNDYYCNCTSEWMGKNCSDEYDACSFKPCQNQANCSSVKRNRQYNCSCTLGFDGVNCEKNIDDCKNVICENGTICFDKINSHECACPSGMTGKNCSEDIDECKSKPCKNGGSCNNMIGSYECKCIYNIETIENYPNLKFPTGFNGTNCEYDINECDYRFPNSNHGICMHGGMCTNNNGSFKCFCDNSGKNQGKYYAGRNCEIVVDYCSNTTKRCQNGGTCQSKTFDKFECICPVGFTGKTCDININECVSNPCKNNATCIDGINSYKCQCVNGTKGKNCEIDINECQSNPCNNGGLCEDLLNRFQCNCADTGFTGPTCSINVDDCIGNLCQNNATCIDGIKNYTCKCYKGYDGKYCETDIDECSTQPCNYSIKCLQRSNQSLYGENRTYFTSKHFSYANASGYKCLCMPGYEGKNCSLEINECLVVNCEYGQCRDLIGRAECICDEGYEGKLCDTDIDECSRKYCQHGSKCFNSMGTYNCTCLKGPSKPWYGGKNCSVELTGCNHSPCLNNGTCNPLFNESNSQHNYSCSCMFGFVGKHCEIITTMSFNRSSLLETEPIVSNILTVEFYYQTTLRNVLICSFLLQNNYSLNFQLKEGKPILMYASILNTPFADANDSAWHFIKFEFNQKNVMVESTGNGCKQKCSFGFIVPDRVSGLSFGNIHSNAVPWNLPLPFVGCIQDVFVNGKILLATNASNNVTMSCPRQEQCLINSCTRRGSCVDLWFQKQCVCDRPYLGNDCEMEVTPGTFAFNNTISFSEYNLTTIGNQLQTYLHLSFYFITRYSNGQIVYFSESTQASFISVKLENGYIVTKMKRCKDFVSTTPNKYDDGKKHFIEVEIHPENFTLNVDSFNKIYVLNDECLLNVSLLTVGKKPANPSSRKRRSATPIDNYRGILQDMTLNNRSVMLNQDNSNIVRLKNTIQPITASNVQSGARPNNECKQNPPCINSNCTYVEFEDYFCNCTPGFTGKNCSLIDFCYYTSCPKNATCGNTEDGYECYVPVTFNTTSSIIYQPNPNVQHFQNFSVHFRTREEQGFLFSTIDSSGNSNFSVYLHNKNLEINFGNITRLPNNVTDGEWHHFFLSWIPTTANIAIDETVIWSDTNTSINYTLLFSIDKFTVGEKFVGCMTNLSINGIHVPLQSGTSNSSSSQHYKILQNHTIQTGCLKNDVCANNKCLNGSTCKDVWNKYVCECKAGFTGQFCGIDIDECSSQPCMNNATCHDKINEYKCECVKGFEGERCENNTDDCATIAGEQVCLHGGNCTDLVAGFNCSCTENYTGDRCEFKINETCTSTNCKNGTCNLFNYTNSIGTTFEVFNCTCDAGFNGTECQFEIDFCLNVNCNGSGNCSVNANRTDYVCNCVDGFEGKDCEIKIDPCAKHPCKNNGTCENKGSSHKCHCPSGWQGKNCEEDINECANRTDWCQNFGKCTNTPGSVICHCNGTGFEGYLCSEDIDECKDPKSNPCQHNSTCDNIVGSYFCDCIPELGYEGKNCDIPSCHNINCHYDSECIITANSWFCLCPKYYEGDFCQCKGPCVSDPCQNGAECIQNCNAQNYSCTCLEGFKGKHCEEDIDECNEPASKFPCKNNSPCTNTVGSYTCDCVDGYIGKNCDLENPCSQNTCNSNGNCSYRLNEARTRLVNTSCACSSGYSGVRCASIIQNSETDFYIYIIIAIVFIVLIIIVAITYFLVTTRKKRATSGTYSPSRQEMSGSRVELGNVWKLPPTERLI